MIRTLAWSDDGRTGPRLVREARFVRSSGVPLALAAFIAGALQRSFAGALNEPAIVAEVYEPAALAAEAWAALCARSRLYLRLGSPSDVTILFDRDDLPRYVAAAFAEAQPAPAEAALSPLEASVVDAIARCTSGALDEWFGPARRALEGGRAGACASYLQVRFGTPLFAGVGIALARDPAAEARAMLDASALEDCPLECDSRIESGPLAAADLLQLRIGDVLRFNAKVASAATLNVNGAMVARGEAGVIENRHALLVRRVGKGGAD